MNLFIEQIELDKDDLLWNTEQLDIVKKEFAKLKMVVENNDLK